ncbi:hypothetical protein AVEN_182966-1 [Araneus ventricosus]|uniref:Transposable element P transposase-like RNase H domain-containing protein n=1 Tax=Araneus ventricosus TaxID=182803 RepID=A0A4Y2LKB0_ARAVE|nr:hypothetical protein AVEN_182966-1 [Araneus ventricosus]
MQTILKCLAPAVFPGVEVCINHFPIKDVITSLKAFNERTGELVQAPLEHKRLVPGAIPSLFPDLPKYFSSEPTTSRENPLDRATRKEMEQLKEAINKSIDEQAENAQLKKIRSYEDLINKFETFSCDDFLKVTQKNQLIFLRLDTSQAPKIAPSAYRFLRQSGYLVLPHPNTINNVCTKYSVSPQFEQLDSYFLLYIKQKFKYLEEKDKVVILMLDEVHIKEYFDYKGGSISGMSYDSETSASSAQVFMVKSVVSRYKDVVHVLPVHTISGNVLHEFVKKVIIGLEGIGFTVIGIITENNSVKRRAVELFIDLPELSYCYPHPVDKSRPLFFVVDPFHLFKCIRNNWLNQKNDGRCFFYPKFDSVHAVQDIADFKTARFTTIRELYNLESDKLVKYGFRLNLKALAPSSMERQNVKLVLCIFNEHVAEALAELGEKNKLLYSQDTSDFLKIIIRWWQIVNVKTPNKGKRLNNRYQEPLSYEEKDIKMAFLEKFLKWIDDWDRIKFSTGTFTKETRTALVLSTKAIIEISSYCKENFNMSYILPGKFQTDDLESRFGCYRKLAGCQYNISTQQLFECEKKTKN